MPGTGWTRKTRRCERSGKITMNETLSLVPALLAGVLLGAIFFGGLWWTIRKGFASTRPALWFLGSMLLRTSIALAGFYFMARDHGERPLLGPVLFRSGGPFARASRPRGRRFGSWAVCYCERALPWPASISWHAIMGRGSWCASWGLSRHASS